MFDSKEMDFSLSPSPPLIPLSPPLKEGRGLAEGAVGDPSPLRDLRRKRGIRGREGSFYKKSYKTLLFWILAKRFAKRYFG